MGGGEHEGRRPKYIFSRRVWGRLGCSTVEASMQQKTRGPGPKALGAGEGQQSGQHAKSTLGRARRAKGARFKRRQGSQLRWMPPLVFCWNASRVEERVWCCIVKRSGAPIWRIEGMRKDPKEVRGCRSCGRLGWWMSRRRRRPVRLGGGQTGTDGSRQERSVAVDLGHGMAVLYHRLATGCGPTPVGRSKVIVNSIGVANVVHTDTTSRHLIGSKAWRGETREGAPLATRG